MTSEEIAAVEERCSTKHLSTPGVKVGVREVLDLLKHIKEQDAELERLDKKLKADWGE